MARGRFKTAANACPVYLLFILCLCFWFHHVHCCANCSTPKVDCLVMHAPTQQMYQVCPLLSEVQRDSPEHLACGNKTRGTGQTRTRNLEVDTGLGVN